MKKWVFFVRHLRLVEILRLSFFFFFKQSERNNISREWLTFKFLEECYKGNRIIASEKHNFKVVNEIELRSFIFTLRKFSSDPLVFNQIILRAEFEWIVRKISERKISMEYMIDAGANIGLTTLYFKAYFPNLKILALEPNDSNTEIFVKNIHLNACKDVVLLKKPLWDNSQARLTIDPSDSLEWGFKYRIIDDSELNILTCQGITITECLNYMNWPRIDFLKIDIEGAEHELFNKGSSFMEILSCTNLLSVEPHDLYTRSLIETTLMENNFHVFFSGEHIFGVRKNQ